MKLGYHQSEWLEALESGRYNHGTGCLKRCYGDWFEYCALGVACDLVGLTGVRAYDGEYYFENGSIIVPKMVLRWLGLYTHDGACRANESEPSIVRMNDELFLSFGEIAARIRLNPRMYFKESK